MIAVLVGVVVVAAGFDRRSGGCAHTRKRLR